MKVRELISQLQGLDPDLMVVGWIEDDEFQAPRHLFRLLHVLEAGTVTGEMDRGQDQVPTIKIGKSEYASTLATITLTADH